MIRVSLEDAAKEPLRQEAQRLGVQNANEMDKDQLVVAIRSERAELPRPTRRRKRWINWTAFGTIAAIVAAGAALWANHRSTSQFNALLEKDEITSWQELVVYSVIDEGFAENNHVEASISSTSKLRISMKH